MAFNGGRVSVSQSAGVRKWEGPERMLTEAEDHDIASNDNRLAIVRRSASTPARCLFLRESRSARPRHLLAHREP